MNLIHSFSRLIEEKLQSLPFDGTPDRLYEPCRYVMENGGKRLRPLLVMMAAGLCGGRPERALPAAVSVELIHNFTLVHDDIMDQAESRRGRESVHFKWDASTAILVGDLLFAEAFRQLTDYAEDSDHELAGRLSSRLLEAVRTVCEGQAMDLELEHAERAVVSDYLRMIEGKTSALISGSLLMGGEVASAGNETLARLDRLGSSIGTAFQIQDDLMDVTADPEKFGKRRGGDIREGKRTFLLLQALEAGNETEKKELYRLMKLPEIDTSGLERVIELFELTGAIDKANESVRNRYGEAVGLLKSFEDSEFKEDLLLLLERLINRET